MLAAAAVILHECRPGINFAEGIALEWSVAVFAARESSKILNETVQAIEEADGRERTIDVLVNGNRLVAETVARLSAARTFGRSSAASTRVWFLPVADKASAWNTYLHGIWPQGTLAYFVDGYATIEPSSLRALASTLDQAPLALGATGVPSIGRSADRLRRLMLSEGGIHGSLYSISAAAMDKLQARCFRLPSSLYRTDALLGAVLYFNLDPQIYRWDPARIAVCPDATWRHRPLRWWNPYDLRSQLYRRIRQAQGRLENAACKNFLAEKKSAIGALPADVLTLLDEWLVAQPEVAAKIMRKDPLSLWALRRLRAVPSTQRVAMQSVEFERIQVSVN